MWTWMWKSSVPIHIDTKAKANNYNGRINFTSMSVSTVALQQEKLHTLKKKKKNELILRNCSEECQKPQPPLLLRKVSQCTSNLYYNTPPICFAVLPVRLRSLRKGKYCQYSSHLYRSTPPICIEIRLPFVPQYFWENLGCCGHRDVPHLWCNRCILEDSSWIQLRNRTVWDSLHGIGSCTTSRLHKLHSKLFPWNCILITWHALLSNNFRIFLRQRYRLPSSSALNWLI